MDFLSPYILETSSVAFDRLFFLGFRSPPVTPSSPDGRNEDWSIRFRCSNTCGGMDDKIEDVCELIKGRRLDILYLNETKRKGSGGAFKRGSFDTYWSGVDQSQRRCRGIGRTHSYTWPRGEDKSVMDFIIVDKQLRSKVVDTRVYRDLNVDIDLFLVVFELRLYASVGDTWRK
ncbi:hypothetical protein EVAR_4329_1 [Eumeta japonica]|uniref:Craniofacial development protein 2 n=1 Tax=Eumeta variegata TaxID=151549 RepID=A0A4C1VEW4_EUMVA|nr:hypothetical protein EVAR_4329_1 [Eumeta japonica]